MDMEKVYEPQKFESDIYAQWLEKDISRRK